MTALLARGEGHARELIAGPPEGVPRGRERS